MKDHFETLKEDIGLQIYKMREENGYSRQEFADMVDISLNSLSSIENGNTLVKISTLYVITNTLSISLSYFFKLLEEKRNQKK
ncbi:helix-turn-helix domain-containing protein [Bacillus cereus group sp. MYBK163-2]|uniref:helix-turn-helix domain-containing protein n=1 Tax=Bacillus cereus group TaxID=86661 RepID=UPI000A30395F|nr:MULTISPECIES: helix-turn-helix transcriptional regulator [Bacillus cereus group]MDA1647682.1 helix-turn-helix transcriptional regulator [Bacillus cereus group sp. TH163-1LC]MDA1797664.1 helix-turn-helix transcriptional regulator [Bacillus cereus group sp. BY8-1LC]SME68406.1 anaerobic benzoate catabolism transcriptional regulator [Bacillus cereus]